MPPPSPPPVAAAPPRAAGASAVRLRLLSGNCRSRARSTAISPIEVLSDDQVETIHLTALKLLRDTGIEVMQDPARAILKAAGAEVDEANPARALRPALIESQIAMAPASFTMQARNRAYDVGCGEGEIIFAATGGPAFAHDCDRGKRPGNFADMVDYLKLVQQLA
jgi:trimethylamine--corrinoid protein Co-methyltransferase